MPERTLTMPLLTNRIDASNTLNELHLDFGIQHPCPSHFWPDGEGSDR
jgi:hypothetical protein